MRGGKPPRAWSVTVLATAIGILCTALLSVAQDEDQTPAFLRGATYTGSPRCSGCHPVKTAAWQKSLHGKLSAGLPWEQTAAEGEEPKPAPEPPTADLVYRYVTGYRAAEGTWVEKGIGCEACHGPGSAHVAGFHGGPKSRLVARADLPTLGQSVSLCGRCHGQYAVGEQRYAADFLPGMDLAKLEGFRLDQAEGAKPFQQLNQLAAGQHLARGVTCLSCHDPHGDTGREHQLNRPVEQICTSCHAHRGMTVAQHAPQAPEGATCATCHMAEGNHMISRAAAPEQ